MNEVDDLAVLVALLAECAGGGGRLALISGGLATGKTELLHAFGTHAVESGALVLTATGARTERSLRMGVVSQLFRSAGRAPELFDDAPQDADPGASPLADARVVRDVCGALLRLAENRPLVIEVDDLQFVDTVSLQVLLYLRRHMGAERLMLVLTEWERPGLARPLLRAELTRAPHARITVGPWSERGVAEFLARRFGTRAANGFAVGGYALTGGNPLLVNALVEDQRGRGGESDVDWMAPVVGGAFRQAVLDCLYRWDPEFLTVATSLAILGDCGTAEVLAELSGMSPPGVSRVVDVLEAAGLVSAGRLRHAEITATILGNLQSEQAVRLHVRAAAILYKRGADARDIAKHIVAAGTVPGPWAARMLQHAANQLAVEDPALAVTCLELAMHGCEGEHEQITLRSTIVRIAWRANPSMAAPHLTPLHDKLYAGELSWPDAVPVIRYRLWQGDLVSAASQLQAVYDSQGPADARTTAELRLAWEWVFGSLRDRTAEQVRTVLMATGPVGAPMSPWWRTATLNKRVTRGAGAEVASSAEHILQGCLGDVLPEVGATALLALDDINRRDRARHWCDRLTDEATRRRTTTWRAVLGCVRAELSWRRGDLLAAHTQASTALGLLPAQCWGVLIGLPLSTLILSSTAMGKAGLAAEWLDRAVPEAMFGTAFGARYLHARGNHHLAAGRTLAAVDDLERCGAWVRGRNFDVPPMMPWGSDLAQAYLKLGMRKQAKELAQEQLDRLGSSGSSRLRAASLRLLASCADLTERTALLREAIRLLERSGDRLEMVRALADLSQVHCELGELGHARLVMRNAEQLAHACHARILPAQQGRAPAADRSVREPEPHTAGATLLSKAERKVAELAAHGHSNREIGRKLYITVSTVEQHLTRVYRKLNVSGRTDLSAELLPSRAVH
ncbi:LuxR C-terminal-related transcriptional regulator [Actinophytocola sp.]|uniref:LuxR C-terminal-related transcriptional regulator n=1 Tax=Actinophytocola sp. TaxID=1872138 RepID=UPI002ED488C2